MLNIRNLSRYGKSLKKITQRMHSEEVGSIGMVSKNLKDSLGLLGGMNKIVEWDPNLTDQQKKERKRFLIYRSNPMDPLDEPCFYSYYISIYFSLQNLL